MNYQVGTILRRETCPNCGGDGKEKKCYSCMGHGYLAGSEGGGFEGSYRPGSPRQRCDDCKGTGKRDKNTPYDARLDSPCNYCQQTGEILVVWGQVKCNRCGGFRNIDVRYGTYPSGMAKIRSEPCPKCGGRGWEYGEVHRPAV
jgi:DnaJ-class molecular chaperone